LVDQKTASTLKRSGFKQIKVRSPLTCELDKGVCQKCYGLDEFKKDADIGDNVGAKAGQAIAEPLVQLAMNSFHSGGVAGSGINASGIKRIDQLLKMPKIVAGAAKLAPVAGTVTSVTPWAGGGNQIIIRGDDGKDYDIKTAQGRKVFVTSGTRVALGDALSDGPIKPQELAAAKGFLPAQRYMVDELQKEYRSQGPNIHAREFETLVRSVTDLAIVTNNPGDSDYIPGDITSFKKLENLNKNRVQTVSLEEAMGSKLAERVATIPAGKVIEERDINLLKTMGYTTVKIEKDKIEFEPNLKNITSLPVLQDDWMAALGYRNLKSVLQEGAATGKTSDMSGYNPIPAYARGTLFGRGKDGKY
jgi:DNA-directed RNA polymerase subunit beta'